MLDFLAKFFGSTDPKGASKYAAKERLRLVLIHDRASVSPEVLASMKEDLIKVISKYVVIDEEGLKVDFDKSDSSVAIVASIPVKEIRRQGR